MIETITIVDFMGVKGNIKQGFSFAPCLNPDLLEKIEFWTELLIDPAEVALYSVNGGIRIN